MLLFRAVGLGYPKHPLAFFWLFHYILVSFSNLFDEHEHIVLVWIPGTQNSELFRQTLGWFLLFCWTAYSGLAQVEYSQLLSKSYSWEHFLAPLEETSQEQHLITEVQLHAVLHISVYLHMDVISSLYLMSTKVEDSSSC